MSFTDEHKTSSKIYVNLIDVIFAIIVGFSFDYNKELLVPPTLSFESASLFLAYVTVVLSWIYYHKAIKLHPHKNLGRFFIDLFLLYLYFYLLRSINDFKTFLFILVIIYGSYLAWTYLRNHEYQIKLLDSKCDRLKTARAVLIFLVFVLMYFHYNPSQDLSVTRYYDGTLIDWIVFIFGLILVIFYRIIPIIFCKKIDGNSIIKD